MGFLAKFLIALLFVVHSSTFFLCISASTLFYLINIYAPSVWFPYEGKGHLGHSGPSTNKFDDLVVKKSTTVIEAEKIAQTHGLAIVESVLTKETSENFRNYILEANQKVKSAFVIEPENRHHIMPSHNEPAVQAAMKEIGEHPILRPLLDRLLGPSCSLTAFSVITNSYGSEDQNWHWDTVTSHAGYPDYFVPEYTLAIPVQDTTREMGATGICPGTHKGSWPNFDYDALERQYLADRTAEEEYGDYETWLTYHFPCHLRANVTAGDGLLYNADVYHRGNGHKDPNGPERVVAFWTFAGSRQGSDDKRTLPLGTVHSLNWKSWGHSIDEFATMKERPWKLWHIFGLFNPKENGVKPWNIFDNFLLIFRGSEGVFYAFTDSLEYDDFSKLLQDLLFYFLITATVYLTVAPILVLIIFVSNRKSDCGIGSKKKLD